MFNTVCRQIAHHSEHQDSSALVLHPDVGDPLALLPEHYAPRVVSQTSLYLKVTQISFPGRLKTCLEDILGNLFVDHFGTA